MRSAEETRKNPQFIARRKRLGKFWPYAWSGLAKNGSEENSEIEALYQKEMKNQLSIWKSLIANSDSDLTLATIDCEVCYIGTLSESETLHPAIGYRWHDFIHPDVIPNMEAAVKECLRTGKRTHYETSTMEPNIPEPVYLRNVIWPVIDEGEAIGLMALSTVITEQKILETKLVQVSAMAAMGEILGAITHEIKNPLSIVQYAVGLLLAANRSSAAPSPDVEKWGVMIEKASERINTTSQTVRNLFRPKENNQTQGLSIREAFNDMSSLCAERFKTANIEFRVKTPNVEFFIPGDLNVFAHCLLNLLNNSYDAVQNSEAAWIQLEFDLIDSELQVSVSDSGMMDPGIRSRVFTSSFTTKKKGLGTGMGLTLCRRMIADLKGEIQLDQTSPTTKFTMSFKTWTTGPASGNTNEQPSGGESKPPAKSA